MNRHESDYDKYRKRARKIRTGVIAVAVLGFIAFVAGPLSDRVRNGRPDIYDLIREKTGVKTIEHYSDEIKESMDTEEAEIVDYKFASVPDLEYKELNLVFNKDSGNLYLADDNGNESLILDNVYNYRISCDGSVIAYISCDDKNLYKYDMESKETTLVDQNIYMVEVSPGGEYFFYHRDEVEARYLAIANVEGAGTTEDIEKTIVDRNLRNVVPIFVSADGRTAYYYTFEGPNDDYEEASVYCYHDGKEIKVYSQGHYSYYTNRTGEELMFWDSAEDYVIYYNPAMSKGAKFLEMDYDGFAPHFPTHKGGRNVFVDCDTLQEGMYFKKP